MKNLQRTGVVILSLTMIISALSPSLSQANGLDIIFEKLKKLDKNYPVVAGVIGSTLICYFLRNPIQRGTKKIIKKFAPKCIQEYLLNEDQKKKNDFYTKISPKETVADLASGKLPRKIQRLIHAKRRGFKLKPILLHGPSGTGKTLTAKIVAKLFAQSINRKSIVLKTSGSGFLDKYVGESPKKINLLLKNAQKISGKSKKRMIYKIIGEITEKIKISGLMDKIKSYFIKGAHVTILIDEIVSLSTGTKGNNDYGWATVEALQIALDEYFPSVRMDLVATANSTNVPPAMRNRFKCIYFGAPTIEEKLNALELHLNKFSRKILKRKYDQLSQDLRTELKNILQPYNLTYRDMAEIANEATQFATYNEGEDHDIITEENIRKGLTEVIENKINEQKSENYTNYYRNNKQGIFSPITTKSKNEYLENLKNLEKERGITILNKPKPNFTMPKGNGHTLKDENRQDKKSLPKWIKERKKRIKVLDKRLRLDPEDKKNKDKENTKNIRRKKIEQPKNKKESRKVKTGFVSKLKYSFSYLSPWKIANLFKKSKSLKNNSSKKKKQLQIQKPDFLKKKNPKTNPKIKKKDNKIKIDKNKLKSMKTKKDRNSSQSKPKINLNNKKILRRKIQNSRRIKSKLLTLV
ncbi:AAA family ATPase [Candidatus Dependentiae bacterium]